MADVTSTRLLQGGRSLFFGRRVVRQLPTAHLTVVKPPLPRAVRLVLDGMVLYYVTSCSTAMKLNGQNQADTHTHTHLIRLALLVTLWTLPAVWNLIIDDSLRLPHLHTNKISFSTDCELPP